VKEVVGKDILLAFRKTNVTKNLPFPAIAGKVPIPCFARDVNS
jgi:hypothetical protein